jgi:hypothetical protein
MLESALAALQSLADPGLLLMLVIGVAAVIQLQLHLIQTDRGIGMNQDAPVRLRLEFRKLLPLSILKIERYIRADAQLHLAVVVAVARHETAWEFTGD